MNFTGKRKLKVILFFIGLIIFYSITFIISDFEKIGDLVNNIKFEYLFIIFPLVLIRKIIKGVRYHIILNKLSIKLPIRESILISIAASSLFIIPGGLGALLKSYILKKKEGKSYSLTTPILIYEKWVELLATVIVVGILLIWYDFLESQIIFVVGIVFSVIMFLIMKNTSWLGLTNKLLVKIKFLKKLVLDQNIFQKSSSKLFSPIFTAETLGLTLVTRVINLISIFLIFQSFQIDMNILISGQIYFTSILLGMLSLVPAGIIIVDGSLLGLLVKNGVDFSIANLLAFVIRLIFLWFGVLVGAIGLKMVLNKKWFNKENT